MARYRVYSDMGTGYGVLIFKTDVSQPSFLDEGLQPGARYAYRIAELPVGGQDERALGRAVVLTYDRAPLAASALIAGSPPKATPTRSPVVVTPAPTSLPPDAILLGLLSARDFIDEFGNLIIAGEVRNDSNIDAGQADVAVTFYDANGAVIGEANGGTLLETLAPGTRSPFLLTLERPPDMADYSLRAVGRPAPPQPEAGLVVVSSQAYEDGTGFYHVTGTVENRGPSTQARVRILSILYTRDGDVINVGEVYATPFRLPPGEQGTFDIAFTYYPKVLSHAEIAVVE